MEAFIKRHSAFWRDGSVIRHTFLSIFLLACGLILTYYSRLYANGKVGYVVPDLLLDSLPVYHVGYIFFQGAFVFICIVVGILIWRPAFIPFTLECSALFFFVRSFFMVMTHLSAPAVEYYEYIKHEDHIKQTLFTISSGNDQFFSAHAGFPFLLALLFWKYKVLRIFFIVCSLVGGSAVILGHLHYSIDVFSSFFISYGVFEVSKFIFKKEYTLTQHVS